MRKITSLIIFLSILGIASANNMETRNVSTYNKINVSGGIVVYLANGHANEIKIETNSALGKIITDVRNGVLIVTSNNTRNNLQESITIYQTQLSEITVTNNSDFKTRNATITGTNCKINISRSADVYAKMDVENIYLTSTGSSDSNLDIKAKSIEINANNASKVRITGNSDLIKIIAKNASDVNCSKLEAKDALIDAKRVSDVKIYATNLVVAKTRGSSDLSIKGNPKLKELDLD